jgi:hypothetical protein
VVKYELSGNENKLAACGAKAYQKMHEACGGPYRIDAEGPRAEAMMIAVNNIVVDATQ